jgi:transposase
MPKPYSLDLRERVVSFVEAGHSRRAAAAHFRVSPSFVINLMTAFRARGAVTPKALGGWRHSKLDPHRVFILRRVAEKDDISMPELAGELYAASGVKADPASLSRWLIRNGLSYKKKPSGQRMRSAWIPERSATRLREADLNILSKLGKQGLEWRLEPEAFAGREVGREDDLLDFLVGCPVDIEVARQPSA